VSIDVARVSSLVGKGARDSLLDSLGRASIIWDRVA